MLYWSSAVEQGVCYQLFHSPKSEADLWLLIYLGKSVISTVAHCLPVQGVVCRPGGRRKVGERKKGREGSTLALLWRKPGENSTAGLSPSWF